MDETDSAIGTSQCSRVVIDSTLRSRYKVEPGHQEWAIAVECICRDRSAIAPLIILKGQHISNNWIGSNTS
jgi:hypothetical protein